jgi:hypothetical protein
MLKNIDKLAKNMTTTTKFMPKLAANGPFKDLLKV